ncbi:MAG: sulfide/dihydroorotate dehydrogenase-like FAD/NAD-binding protein [Candidatus Omnitrophica bacterium]|nr:sulfide/dihydroorotate dehydrogenase-like FAD/NAD-binding protein [Candidatus Omnitrophota bacterium]
MRIISKEVIALCAGTRIVKISLVAPELSRKVQAGQFAVIMVDEKGERVPLTIVESDSAAGNVTLIFQEAGLTTKFLGSLNTGDNLYAVLGPLGHPTQIKNYGKAILVGGGVGIAEILPVARALKKAGNHITSILGAKNKCLLILEDELKDASDLIYVATDDGSYGRKGLTTDILSELLNKDKYDLVYSVGPIPMMRKAAEAAGEYNTDSLVSLNALMVDATGMCGCCRVSVFGKVRFSCVDGPDFDGRGVDWEELGKRNKMYNEQEKHICKLSPLFK